MDLAREILKVVETHGRPDQWGTVKVSGRDPVEISEHIRLLADAGFLIAEDVSTFGAFEWQTKGLTWEGHNFLDSIRNDTVWSRVKEAIAAKGGGAGLEIVKELAVQIGRKYFLGD
jgi:hypothetical protein